MEPQIPYNDGSVEEAAHSLLTMSNQPADYTSQHQPSLTLGSFQLPPEALMPDLIPDSLYHFGPFLSLDTFPQYFCERAFLTANAAFIGRPNKLLGSQPAVDMQIENGQEYGAAWGFPAHRVATVSTPSSEAVPNVNSAPKLGPSPHILHPSAHEQPFGTGTGASLSQPRGPQVVDCLGWNNCRESCTILPDSAHPAIPSYPFSQHEPGPSERRFEVLSAAMELQAARDDFPATGLNQSLVLMQSSCYDEESEKVDSEFLKAYGQFVETQQRLQLQDGQKHGAIVGGPAHFSVPSPPTMTDFEGGLGADLMTYLDRWLTNQWHGLQEELAPGYWPTAALRPDLDEGSCLDLPGPDYIDERIDFHTSLSNADVPSNGLWPSVMDEMSPGANPDDKAAVEKGDRQPDCGIGAQHSDKESIEEGSRTRNPESRKRHYYPQNSSDHLRSGRKRACRASGRPRQQTRRAKRPRKHGEDSDKLPKDGEEDYVRVTGIIDRTGERYTWHTRVGWQDGRKRRAEKELILSSKPWQSLTVRPAEKPEVKICSDDTGANFVGEVAYVGKLYLSHTVVEEMCEDPERHIGVSRNLAR